MSDYNDHNESDKDILSIQSQTKSCRNKIRAKLKKGITQKSGDKNRSFCFP
jgi:hypothetical protein